eukprot:3206494-Pleurochrysis_carterae.AAC.1
MRESTREWESKKEGERGRKGKEGEIGSERERVRERGYKVNICTKPLSSLHISSRHSTCTCVSAFACSCLQASEFVKRAYLQLWSAPCSRLIFAPHETQCGARACVRHTRKEFVKRA